MPCGLCETKQASDAVSPPQPETYVKLLHASAEYSSPSQVTACKPVQNVVQVIELEHAVNSTIKVQFVNDRQEWSVAYLGARK